MPCGKQDLWRRPGVRKLRERFASSRGAVGFGRHGLRSSGIFDLAVVGALRHNDNSGLRYRSRVLARLARASTQPLDDPN